VDEAHVIGQRVRSWRRYRGLSLAECAGLAGISTSYLSMIERGERPLDKLSKRAAIAEALGISVADLSGMPHPPTDAAQKRAHATVARVRLALLDTAALAEPGRTLDESKAAVRHAEQLRDRGEYDRLGELVPGVLADLAALAAAGQREAWRLSVALTGTSSTMLRNLGYLSDALIAAERSRAAAEEYGDPVLIAASAFFTGKALIPAGALTTAEHSQTEAADRIADLRGTDDHARAIFAALHLNAGWACSIDRRADDAFAHLDLAADVARTVTDPGFTEALLGGGVSTTDIEICRTSLAVELGDDAGAVHAAEGVNPSAVQSPARQATYYADLGRALSRDRRHDREAFRALRRAEDLTPQRVRPSTSCKETVRELRARTRRSGIGRELELMASRLGVE
jgi:transcriptional regulator with XRE-family HTH domain